MRRDLDDLVAAIQSSCRSLFLLNFPTTGWFGDKTVSLVEQTLKRGVGRLDGHHQHRRPEGAARRDARPARKLGPRHRDVPAASRHQASRTFRPSIGMTLMEKNAGKVDETIAAIRRSFRTSRAERAAPEHRPRVRHYFANLGYGGVVRHHAEILARRRATTAKQTGSPLHPVKFLEDRYQALIGKYYETRQVAAAVHGAVVLVLRRRLLGPVSLLDLGREGRQPPRERLRSASALWDSERRRELRDDVVGERCSHCWTPCEAYPTILGNLARATVSRSRPRREVTRVRPAKAGPSV